MVYVVCVVRHVHRLCAVFSACSTHVETSRGEAFRTFFTEERHRYQPAGDSGAGTVSCVCESIRSITFSVQPLLLLLCRSVCAHASLERHQVAKQSSLVGLWEAHLLMADTAGEGSTDSPAAPMRCQQRVLLHVFDRDPRQAGKVFVAGPIGGDDQAHAAGELGRRREVYRFNLRLGLCVQGDAAREVLTERQGVSRTHYGGDGSDPDAAAQTPNASESGRLSRQISQACLCLSVHGFRV